MIVTKKLKTAAEIRSFVAFQFSHFKDNPYWVPPIISEEIEVFDSENNPAFKNAEAHLFMAYKDDKPVGRIAAIINWFEVNEQKKAKMRFGWFDAIDDLDVTKALLKEVEEIGRENNLSFLEGPVGFSNMDKAGLLVEGFDEMNTMITWYNYPYYSSHFEQLEFEKANEWVEYKISIPAEGPSEKVRKFSNLIMKRNNLKIIRFKNKKEIVHYADEMFDLLNKTYSKLSTFVPVQPEQIEYFKEKYLPYIHLDFINCVADQDDNLVAFAITMPSYTKALQRAKGSLFLFGWFHLLWATHFTDKAAFYLIGIKPEFQNKGLTAIIFKEMNDVFNRRGISEVETNPELVENKAVQALWNSYESRQHKRRRTYRREIKQ